MSKNSSSGHNTMEHKMQNDSNSVQLIYSSTISFYVSFVMLFWPNSFRYSVQEVTSAKSEQNLWCPLRLSCALLGFSASSVGFKSIFSTLGSVCASTIVLRRDLLFKSSQSTLASCADASPSVWLDFRRSSFVKGTSTLKPSKKEQHMPSPGQPLWQEMQN